MKKIFLIAIFWSLIFIFTPFLTVEAGLVPCGLTSDDPTQPGDQTVACQFCHLFVLFKNVVGFVLIKLVPPLAALMIAIGGFMYMFAYFGKGEPLMLSQAKKLIISVIIGLLIIYGAWIIVNTFLQVIGVAEWTNLKNWWQIKCP